MKKIKIIIGLVLVAVFLLSGLPVAGALRRLCLRGNLITDNSMKEYFRCVTWEE